MKHLARIDAHHHLWHYTAADFGWLEGDLASLRRDFLVPELERETHRAGVLGTVAVQARQSLDETDWLLRLASDTPRILGVVGWLPLRDPHFPTLLQRYSRHPLLKGVRHVVQAEPAGFMDDPAFNAGIHALRGSNLVYDILIFERQLEEAIRLVDRHPQQLFVLDHIAKPRIAAAELQPWASHIHDLARRGNVVCKLSGMVTEADPHSWTPEQLKPFFDTVLEAFTPARLMVGTDWPVLLAGCEYSRWWELVATWISGLSTAEQDEITARTAVRTYRLTPRDATEPSDGGTTA